LCKCSGGAVVRGAYEADAGKEKYAAKDKEDDDLLDILCTGPAVHEIDRSQDETGYAQENKYDANDPFLHDSAFFSR
jgi:hypothetical protein